MRRSFLLIIALLISGITIFGEGQSDRHTIPPLINKSEENVEKIWMLNKGETINLSGIEVRVTSLENLPKNSIIVAQMIDMKGEYRKGESIRISGQNPLNGIKLKRDSGNASYEIIRQDESEFSLNFIDNLDLFAYAFGNPKKIPIEKFNLEVEVSIPDNDPEKRIILVYVPSLDSWVPPYHPESGITSMRRDAEKLIITISSWPTDDKMIASGP